MVTGQHLRNAHGLGPTKLPLVDIGIVLLLLALYAAVPPGVNSAIIWACLLLQYGLLISSVWRPITVYPGVPTYVTAEFLFLFFSYLIFFYPYQLYVLGSFNLGETQYFLADTSVSQTNHAILLSTLGVVAFRGGIRSLRGPVVGSDADGPVSDLDQVSIQRLALPVFVIQASLLAAYQAAGLSAAGESRYTGSTAGGPVAEGVYLGITVLSMVAFALYAAPKVESDPQRSIFLWASVFLSGAWAVRVLLAGDRNSFLLIAIVGIGGFFTFRLGVGRWALVVLCAVALALYSAVEQLRSGQIGSLVDFLGDGAPVAGPGNETSFNISTISVRVALAIVPEDFDYGYGLYSLVGFAGVIPFIRGMVIPPDMTYTQSSDILTAVLLGPSAGWGVGSTVIGDAYMDFGLLGVPVVMYLLGAAVCYVQNAAIRGPASPWRIVLYLITLALIAEVPRYTSAFPIRPLVWVVLLFWVVSMLTPLKASRSRKPYER